MSNLVVVAYDDEQTAERVLDTLGRLQKDYLIDLEDAVYVTKGQDGTVKLHQSMNLAGAGAASGALWGGLIGLLFFMPVVGAAIGAGTGALGGKLTDIGVDDRFAKDLGERLRPGTSAVLALVRRSTPDKVLPELQQYGGQVLQTSLPHDAEERLRAALAQGR
jgi:uncharacterized membrane protein